MIKVGLTGGIGSGKSTISKMISEKKIPIIDADIIAKEVLVKYPEILQKVRVEFGSSFFDWKDEFRRKEFGNHIFRFPKQRIKYEEIIMPYINRELLEKLKNYEDSKEKIVIFDAPTLIEANLHSYMDLIVVVWVDKNMQLQRLKSRDNLSKIEAVNRVNSQMNLEKKLTFANIVINNNRDLINTKNQVDQLVSFLKSLCS